MKLSFVIATSVLASVLSLTASAGEPASGTYVAVRGSAYSICTDTTACSTQSGIYRVVLFNRKAPFLERRLVVSGGFKGWLEFSGGSGSIEQIVENCKYLVNEQVATASHDLQDQKTGAKISTHGDELVITGCNEDSISVRETLYIDGDSSTGVFRGAQGYIELEGTLGLINSGSVVGGYVELP